MRNTLRYLTSLTLLALLSSCASPPVIPEWVSAPNKCTVLLGGSGTVFQDNALNDRWFTINKTVSNNLADALTTDGYRIDRLIVDIRDNNARLKILGAEMNRSGCNKVVQVAHSLIGLGQVANSFQFTVSVLGVSPNSNGIAFTKEYEKTYTFPLTKEVMENLSLSLLAAQMATDVGNAGSLIKSGGAVQ